MLMSEPDHIWLRPMPNLMKGRRPAAFPFFYIGEPFARRLCSTVTRKLHHNGQHICHEDMANDHQTEDQQPMGS